MSYYESISFSPSDLDDAAIGRALRQAIPEFGAEDSPEWAAWSKWANSAQEEALEGAWEN